MIALEASENVHAGGPESGVRTVNSGCAMRRFAEMGLDRLYADLALPITGREPGVGMTRGLLARRPFDTADGEVLPDEGSPDPPRDALASGGASVAVEGAAGGSPSLGAALPRCRSR